MCMYTQGMHRAPRVSLYRCAPSHSPAARGVSSIPLPSSFFINLSSFAYRRVNGARRDAFISSLSPSLRRQTGPREPGEQKIRKLWGDAGGGGGDESQSMELILVIDIISRGSLAQCSPIS